jgi:hypothetical protein
MRVLSDPREVLKRWLDGSETLSQEELVSYVRAVLDDEGENEPLEEKEVAP